MDRKPIDIKEATRMMEMVPEFSLNYYYTFAVLLRNQADKCQQEKNLIDYYILLLRYTSLLSETIPIHPDYSTSDNAQKICYKKKLLDALRELEALRPEAEREIAKVNRDHALKEQMRLNNLRQVQDASRESSDHTEKRTRRKRVRDILAKLKREQSLKGEIRQNNLREAQIASQASSSRQAPGSRTASLCPDSKQVSGHKAIAIAKTVLSAPPIESLVIGDTGLGESSIVDSSSSTTENLSGRHDEGSYSAASSCIICYEAPVEGACVPCGHMAGCMSCLNSIKAKSWGCPICRAKVELVLRLYAV